ncbi:MAG TPA: hypothetical protein VGI83_07875 [Gemmatimonadales bacterium]
MTDASVRRDVHHAAAAHGVPVLDVSMPLPRRARRRSYGGLVYDMAPWDDRAMAALVDVRASFPTLPIFLVVPTGVRSASLLARGVALPCVHGIVYASGAGPRVKEGLQVLLASGPAAVVGQILRALFPRLPDRVADYVGYVINRLEDGRNAVRVSDLLPLLSVTPRVAERAFAQAGLPTPKRLADWLTLMVIALSAERGRSTLAEAARLFGYNANDFYRLRHRVLPPSVGGLDAHATQAFDITLLAFAEACGISRERALTAITAPAEQRAMLA